jgi:uncharacterized RDD family membrane protein YckC
VQELDLDRLIGAQTVAAPPPRAVEAPALAVTAKARQAASADSGAAGDGTSVDGGSGGSRLPLFTGGKAGAAAEAPAPRRAGTPLSVRRSTPDVPRGRSARTPRPPARRDEPALDLQLDSTTDTPVEVGERPTRASAVERAAAPVPASAFARLLAAILDLVVLGAMNAAVLYLTLAIAGLTIDEVRLLPVVPLGAFLLLLNGGYLVAFTAAGGQTIGKMAAGIRVMNDDYERVDLTGALLRAAGCVLSLLTVGAGFLPVVLSAERRALQDRLAGTRVVRAR